VDFSEDEAVLRAPPTEEIKLNPYTFGVMMPVDFATWNELRYSSLEVAVTHSQDLEYWEFASNECLYFARIDCLHHFKEKPSKPSSSSSPSESSASNNPWVGELKCIGLVYLTPSQFTGELNVGISLAHHQRGAGRARIAIDKLLKWVFEEAGYHRVQAAIMDGPHHYAAMNLFANVGFSHEGIRRRQVYNSRFQRWIDVTYMAIVDTDWTLRKIRPDLPKTRWDNLFERQQREREELLDLEAGQACRTPKMTRSMKTIEKCALETNPFESEFQMEERNEEIEMATEKIVGSAIQSEQDHDPEGGLPLRSSTPQRNSFSSERGQYSRSDTEEDGRAVNEDEEHSRDASDLDIEQNMSQPPDSDYPGSTLSFDSDFDDDMSTKSWDRCSVVEFV